MQKLSYPDTALLGLQYDAETFSNVAKVCNRNERHRDSGADQFITLKHAPTHGCRMAHSNGAYTR